jgi:hypothetical protein
VSAPLAARWITPGASLVNTLMGLALPCHRHIAKVTRPPSRGTFDGVVGSQHAKPETGYL